MARAASDRALRSVRTGARAACPSTQRPLIGISGTRQQAGFTLIEMLIAIAIFALLMISVYQSLDQGYRAYRTVEQSRDLNETARIILDGIQDDLQSAVIFSENTDMAFVGEHVAGMSGQSADRLVFASLNHLALDPNAPESDVAEIEYSMRSDPDTRRPLLVRREKPYLDDDHEQGGAVMLLSDRVRGIRFRYLDGTDQVKDEWDARSLGDSLAHEQGQTLTTTVNTGILPQAVETTLVLQDADGKDVAFTSLTRLALAKPPTVTDAELAQ